MSSAEGAIAVPAATVPADHELQPELVPHATAEGRPRSGRERKTVEAYKPEAPKIYDHTIHQGKGSKLSEIPNVLFSISSNFKGDSELIQTLHQLFYNRPGKSTTRKKDVLQFSGFVFDEEAKGREKVLERITKLNGKILDSILSVFELGRDGIKDEKVKRLAELLEAPKAVGSRDLAAADAKKKADVKRKREKAKAKESTPAKKKATKGKKGEEEEEEEEEEEVEEEVEAPAKKRRTSQTKKDPPPAKKEKAPKTPKEKSNDAKPKAQSAKKGAPAASTPVPREPSAATVDPSDDQVREAIDVIIQDKDLETFSMKSLLVDLAVKWPGVSFAGDRKTFVKDHATKMIEDLQNAAMDKDETKAEDA